MAETLAEENSRLRSEIANFKANIHSGQGLIEAARNQLAGERRDFESEVKVVKEFMRAFEAVRNAIISGRL